MNKKHRALIPFVALLSLTLSSACDSSRRSSIQPPTDPGSCVPHNVPGELIVVFQDTTTEAEARALIDAYGLQVLRVSIGFSEGLDFRWLLVGVPPGTESFWIAELLKSPLVTIAEQNSVICLD